MSYSLIAKLSSAQLHCFFLSLITAAKKTPKKQKTTVHYLFRYQTAGSYHLQLSDENYDVISN